ncbi:TPA: PD-(D/E)XK nuclease-like domain-containing protein [Enterobacter hormaechei subsp. xiangfangensis]|uniref:RecE family exodeoxyribonuclease n=1 Tax=Enterobacter hormaechei TaxID=158836 RepID=UPI00287596F0|nr:RecE family exodeoxyribonuclease [Enterobacter hormaechei]MDS0041208.1 PD-(D/E)XK nuclease-like domain-containing protein [Enterobacter hormaechei subsp. xiangfangensis]MDS0097774.1 PD-(D/E)XK nuclease-like domain-containing protein [Enterobacter hormaechei subsp. xiangfangensis]HAS0969930.1 exodeoxyribonuclease [Enterobacter hormaechei]HED1392313.1 PD-(D/E)XK nuclease-like domain-containing protein [Enterobacter hormaechei subsp. xiangfangensis]HED3782864.1 PD-(D/E)XK nuclease-like domain-
MTNTNPVFLVRRAKKQSGQPDAVLWCSEDFETANATLDYLLLKSGRKFKDYYKAVATNFPVVNELPPEGEISFTFCDYYQLDKGKMNWEQIPGVSLPEHPATQKAEMAEASVVNGVDTSTGEIVDEQAFNEADAVPPTNSDLKIDEGDDENTRYPIVQMSFRKQLLSQLTSDELRYHLTQAEYQEISTLEMDTDNGYVQNLLLAAASVEKIQTLDMPFLWKYTRAVKDVFDMEKRHELSLILKFTQVWAETSHLDRGLLVKEWCKGNRVSAIQRTESGANAGGGNKTDRNESLKHDMDSLDIEIALATLPMDFNIYELPGSVYRRAKEIVKKKESPFKEWSAALRATPGILDYSRAAIFALIREAGEHLAHFPDRLRGYINSNLTESDHANPTAETLTAARHIPEKDAVEEINRQLAADRGEYVEGISDPTDPKWVNTQTQPEVENLGGGIYSIDGLLNQSASNEVEKTEVETTSNVQVQENNSNEEPTCDALSPGKVVLQPGKSSADTGEEPATVESSAAEILATSAPSLASQDRADATQIPDLVDQNEPESAQNEPEVHQEEPAVEYPAYFEPGRYEGLPNEVYHAANGISSTQVKDARVSLMYFNARHVEKTIVKERSAVLDMGNLVHALALQPEQLDAEFSIEPVIPEGAFTTAATLRAFIDEYNASLPALLSADDIKVLLEQYNATLPAQVPLGASLEETAQNYMALPADFQRIDADQKQTATAMKACIKEYNATLPAQVKTSGSRDALLEQLATINPDLVAQEAQKPQPLKVSGTKADLIQAVKSVKPDAVFADELLDAWRDNPEGKVLVTRQQLSTALNIQKSLLAHPTASMLLTHPSRAVEVSYFGFDEETGLEVRVRPDLEIDLDGVRIGADLKTISMWNVKQESLRARLHREIIERDYHLSAAMYCETAALDQFFWIFVNKDENYHWIAIIEASAELMELGMLEYRKAMRAIATGFDTGEWPAPIIDDYIDELNDFDLRRLEALRTQA